MAVIHTKLPERMGELRLAEQLKALPDDSLHVWFSVNFIPNVKDIGIILWHELVGVFVVEVKAVALQDIERFGWQSCKIKHRDEDQGPEQQASSALYSLKNFLAHLACSHDRRL